MIETETQIRVRYADTDMMAVVYHANYANYFEIARTECFRQIGLPYADIEKAGIRLPVIDLHLKYIRPAVYDDLLTVKVTVREMPTVKITFHYEIFNQRNELLVTGESTLVFTNLQTGRPMRMPENLEQSLKKFFE